MTGKASVDNYADLAQIADFRQFKTYMPFLAAFVLAIGLYEISIYNYLLFHSLAEVFSVLIAFGIFLVAWNCRHYLDNHYILFIGIAYLFVGLLDLAHAFSYDGMRLLPKYGANEATQLWIAMRYVESLTLLVAPVALHRRIKPGFVFLGYSAVSVFLLLSILYWKIFPACFVEGAGGLTPFKKNSEYLISFILLSSGALIVHYRHRFDPRVMQWLLASILFAVTAELSFTTYASVYGFSNMLGHYFEIVATYFMYKAVIETGLAKPYNLLFRELDQQREWLHVTIGSIGDAVIAVDVAGRVTFLNSVASSLTAWTVQDAVGQPIGHVMRVVDENNCEIIDEIVARVLEQGCVLNIANRTDLICRDGCEISIEDSAAPIKDGAGHIIGAVIVFRDVTEKRQSQQRLLESERRFRSVVESNMIGVVFADPKSGLVTDANNEFLRIIGRNREEMAAGAINWKDITPPEMLEKEAHIVECQPMDTPVPGFEKEYVRPDGTRVPVIIGGSFLDDTQPRVVAYVLDNTKRKQTEEALVNSERMHRALAHELDIERSKLAAAISKMPIGLGISDTRGTPLLMNQAALQLHGFESEADIPSSLEAYVPMFELRYADGRLMPPEEWPIARALCGDFVQDCELVLRNRLREEERICLYSVAPVTNGKDDVNLFVCTMQDITEIKQAERTLRRSTEKFELLSRTAEHLLASEDPQNLAEDLCCEVMAFLDCQVFFNFLVDERVGKLHLNTYVGIPESEARKIEWLDFGVAVCGCAARDQRRIVVEDILTTCDNRTDLVKSFGIQAYCCHPLIIEGRLIGTLSFGTKTRSHFTSEEVELMRTVADNVAVAMQRIQTQEKMRSVNEELERKVLERTHELAGQYEKLSLANAQLKIRAEQLRKLASEITMVEQRERKRLSKILHDGLQQHLVTAKLKVGYLADKLDDRDLMQEGYEIEKIIGESIKMSRSLSAELSPPILHEAGLSAGLEWLTRWMRDKHDFKVELSTDTNAELPEDVTVMIFESVREMLFNAVKHAKVSCAAVNLRENMDGRIQVVVSDKGAGFDPAQLNDVGSTLGGLGLFSIRERVEMMGGNFKIESAPGKGGCFTLEIPRSKPAAAACVDPSFVPPDDSPETGRCDFAVRMLLADDHALFRDGIGRILNKEPDIEIVGYARDGAEAIELSRTLKPHVVLMDISMPGVDGIEATRTICREDPAIQVIGLSMYEDQERGQAMLDAGAVGYNTKGCAASELLSAIRACMHMKAYDAPGDIQT